MTFDLEKDYKELLTDYLEIVSRFADDGLSKQQRKQRHLLLSEWQRQIYDEPLPTLEELEAFRKNHGKYYHNPIFVRKAIVPAVQKDIEAGGIEGIRFLFNCFQDRECDYYTRSVLYFFCEALDYKYAPVSLAHQLLVHEPNNEFALKYLYHHLKYFLEFSIHEMPTGILTGMDGASIDSLSEMLEDVNEFERVSKKLNIPPDEVLINDCRRYYKAYRDYLLHRNAYKDFEDYLHMNRIPYV